MKSKFDLALGLERLLLRHPKLREDKAICQALEQKERLDVTSFLPIFRKYFVIPEYTLSICSIYRGILLKLLVNFGESTEGGSDVAHSLALVKAAILVPHTKRVVTQLLRSRPCPIDEPLSSSSIDTHLTLEEICQACVVALEIIPELKQIWGFTPWIHKLQHKSAIVRWCAVQSLSRCLGLSDASKQRLSSQVLTEDDKLDCAFEWEKVHRIFENEKAIMWIPGQSTTSPNASLDSNGEMDANDMDVDHDANYSMHEQCGDVLAAPHGYVEICGMELPCREGEPEGVAVPDVDSAFISTPTVDCNLQCAALALCQGRPLLLEGPPGSGKTCLIRELARLTGNTDLVHIHIDDQMDAKNLLGSYICTSVPGEFVWQPGPLAQAVSQGKWLVIEDINLAPPSVLASLIPLLESGQLPVPQRAEVIKAAPGLQIFATVTCAPKGTTAGAYGNSDNVKEILGGLLSHVQVQNPSTNEQLTILNGQFPQLRHMLPFAMTTLRLVQKATGQSNNNAEENGGKNGDLDWNKIDGFVDACLELQGIAGHNMKLHIGRHFSLRDLMKWCNRMKVLHCEILERSFRALQQEDYGDVTRLPIIVRQAALVECIDCFAQMLHDKTACNQLMNSIASVWGLGEHDVEMHQGLNKPSVRLDGSALSIGRVKVHSFSVERTGKQAGLEASGFFSHTGHALRMMERLSVCLKQAESALLVGETGTGKTAVVQHIAQQVGAKLVVLNLSQQTDSSDLLGGFRPVSAQEALVPLLPRFVELVRRTWTKGNNEAFIARAVKYAERHQWKKLEDAFKVAIKKVRHAVAPVQTDAQEQEEKDPGMKRKKKGNGTGSVKPNKKRKQDLSASIRHEWGILEEDLSRASLLRQASETPFAFSFIEGTLVKALKNGWWILLDEINLAPPEVLESLAGILEPGNSTTLTVTENASAPVKRHPNFRLIGAMNPGNDAGKRELPASLRNRFSEFWYPEPDHADDLEIMVRAYLEGVGHNVPVGQVVDFYRAAKNEAETSLLDGAGQKPAYNLRTLCRWLLYVRNMVGAYGLRRSLYDGASMAFLTQLDTESAPKMEKLIRRVLLNGAHDMKVLNRAPREPVSGGHVLFEQFWVEVGDQELPEGNLSQDGSGKKFVLTKTIRENLKNLARAVLLRKFPILLQGPTSSGKTSLVSYLAAQTGHKLLRINNHEHTDLQEYLGTYIADETGKLVFREGALVQAVRKGYWVVLDELNLAPTEVLEALNRLLDDNRELFIPETQETVKPHPHFMLFATQNPPGVYAGRKVLSRAFRSRFLELHVDDIPDGELATILENRCLIPGSYAGKLVEVMRELQRRRQISNAFAGKHGFITPRDLFRWADREAVGYQQLAENGYLILGERLRNTDEKQIVKEVLEKVMRVKLDIWSIYDREGEAPVERLTQAMRVENSGTEIEGARIALKGIVWTASMRRMYTLLDRCLEKSEPALLVGETGTGKTTVCQMLAFMRGQKLHIVNCNQHTETSDFLGGFRPTRDRERALAKFQEAAEKLAASPLFKEFGCEPPDFPESFVGLDLLSESKKGKSAVGLLERAIKSSTEQDRSGKKRKHIDKTQEALQSVAQLKSLVTEMTNAGILARVPFTWVDGPLVDAMRNGDMILIDELNLAEDAVIERMNSVLEVGRTLTLAEKGGEPAEIVKGADSFRLVATMNPGGDYGKKELSPALSNRFTQVWVPAIESVDELEAIVRSRLKDGDARESLTGRLISFWQFFQPLANALRTTVTVRDLLSWVNFINCSVGQIGVIPAYVHGAYLVLLDGVGLGTGSPTEMAQEVQSKCAEYLTGQIPEASSNLVKEAAGKLTGQHGNVVNGHWGIAPFYIPQGPHPVSETLTFNLEAPTPGRNGFRLLRALQLKKAILLEGSPGVGKTSLVCALAKLSGHRLVRINLSEQTDMMDLLGGDLPVPGGEAGEFRWCDGPLLAAIKSGDWVLLDELNLANQQVLEGLNAVLDHRAEVYIPELSQTFKCPATFRLFGAQNPLKEGGGRKGLPKSFLNRFTRVYVEGLTAEDMNFIAGSLSPKIPRELLAKMVLFLNTMHSKVCVEHCMGTVGGPWEFNLRDLLRWCELVESSSAESTREDVDALLRSIHAFGRVLFLHRFRTQRDREMVQALYEDVWGVSLPSGQPDIALSTETLFIGSTTIQRSSRGNGLGTDPAASLQLLSSQRHVLECAAVCVERGWPCLLVGNSCSGKNSAVRVLSKMCGKNLVEIALTQGTDTSDLLGGFEQMEPARKVKEVYEDCRKFVDGMVDGLMNLDSVECVQPQDRLDAVRDVLSLWSSFEGVVAVNQQMGHATEQELLEELTVLGNVLDQLGSLAVKRLGAAEGFEEQASNLLQQLSAVHKLCTSTKDHKPTAGRFEWVDGALCRAMEQGHWVLLDNANLCNPTVLDRLNSVLEPGGVLYLNECGGVTGEPRVIVPHPQFRLFLAYNPQNGEVSRAMRNRGTEVFVLSQGHGKDGLRKEGTSGACSKLTDLQQMLVNDGVTSPLMSMGMSRAHMNLCEKALSGTVQSATTRDLSQCAKLSALLIYRGWDSVDALRMAWDQVYVRRESSENGRSIAACVFEEICLPHLRSALSGPSETKEAEEVEMCRFLNPGLPHLLGVDTLAADSQITLLHSETAVLQGLVAQSCAAEVGSRFSKTSNEESFNTGGLVQYAHLLPTAIQESCFGASSAWNMETGKKTVGMVMSPEVGTDSLGFVEVFAAGRLLIQRSAYCQIPVILNWCQKLLLHYQGVSMGLGLNEGNAVMNAMHLVCNLLSQFGATGEKLLGHGPADGNAIVPLDDAYGTGLHRKPEHTAPALPSTVLAETLVAISHHVFESLVCHTLDSASHFSPYLLSYQTFSNPQHRLSKKTAHTRILEWIFPVFSVIKEIETWAVENWNRTVAGLGVGKLQEWRWAMFECCHGIEVKGSVRADAVDLDKLCFVWLKMSKALKGFIEQREVPAELTARTLHAIEGLNGALSLPNEPPSRPLLWQFAGHPQLPQTEGQMRALTTLENICESLTVTSDGFQIDRTGQAKVLVVSGVCGTGDCNEQERKCEVLDIEGKVGEDADDCAEAMAAVLTCDAGLRRIMLEGLSVASSSALHSAHETDTSNTHVLAEILDLIKKEIAQKAETTMGNSTICMDSALSGMGATLMDGGSMVHKVCRNLQIELLNLLQATRMAHGVNMLPYVTAKCIRNDRFQSTCAHSMNGDLPRMIDTVISAGLSNYGQCVLDLAPFQELKWILEMQGSDQNCDFENGWVSAVHNMWFRWQRSLWENCLRVPVDANVGAEIGVHISSSLMEGWNDVYGPGRLHQACITVSASSLVAKPPCIEDAPHKVQQLKLAAKQIFKAGTADPAHALRSHLWSNLALLFTQIVMAHERSFLDTSERVVEILVGILEYVNRGKGQHVDVDGIVDALVDGLSMSGHRLLVGSLQTHLVPFVRALLEGVHLDGSMQLTLLGKAWVYLGSLRLHLVLPPAGLDPSGKHAFKIQHINDHIKHQIDPEIRVRHQLQQLPSGWDESVHLTNLETEKQALMDKVSDMESKCVLRPAVSQYRHLQKELQRFLKGVGSTQRLAQLMSSLHNAPSSFLNEAKTWQDTALGLCARLSENFPLYRDIVQPVHLALLEICHGLGTLTTSVQIQSAQMPRVMQLVSDLMSFPKKECDRLKDQAVQDFVGGVIKQAVASQQQGGKGMEGADSAVYSVRLTSLRIALRSLLVRLLASSSPIESKTLAGELDAIFQTFLHFWEELKDLQEAKEQEEAQMYKSKARTTSFETPEEEEERRYKTMFPDHWASFDDLADLDTEDLANGTEHLNHGNAEPAGEEESVIAADLSSLSAQALMNGKILREIVDCHRTAYRVLCGQSDSISASRMFEEEYGLGSTLLAASGGLLPREVDDVTMTGHLLRVSIEHNRLCESAATSASEAVKGSGAIDIHKPCVREVSLARTPLLALTGRLKGLLAEWPDHPILCQLKRICERVLQLDVTSPIKKVLVGVELLLAKAQVWEETAASHVSLKEELKGIAGLATRWRKLELHNWGNLLDKTLQNHAQGAHSSWFPVYRLIMECTGESSNTKDKPENEMLASVASSLEQFIQTSTIGEFAERMQILSSFQQQLELSPTNAQAVQLSSILQNLAAFYGQYNGAVEGRLQAGLSPVQKELENFVKLSRWEDRGYYAMKESAERSQRKLHKLCLKAEDVLKHAAALVFSQVGESMGLKDLSGKQETHSGVGKSDDVTVGVKEKWGSFCVAVCNKEGVESGGDTDLESELVDALGLGNAELRYNQMPKLVGRMQTLLGNIPEGLFNEGSKFDGVAVAVISRVEELQKDSSKSAKTRKRKALSDFLKYLEEMGVSKRRSAIPKHDQDIGSWFKRPVVTSLEFLKSACTTQCIPSGLVTDSETHWRKADAYYYKTMARVQRILEAGKKPCPDLAKHEIDAIVHFSEHLLYLLHVQRQVLNGVCCEGARLDRLYEVIQNLAASKEDLSKPGTEGKLEDKGEGRFPLPVQSKMKKWTQCLSSVLSRLDSLVKDTMELLRTTDAVGMSAPVSTLIAKGQSLLQHCQSRIGASRDKFKTLASTTGDVMFTRVEYRVLHEICADIKDLHSYLMENEAIDAQLSDMEEPREQKATLSNCLPSWAFLISAFDQAASHYAEFNADFCTVEYDSSSSSLVDAGKEFSNCLEAVVQKVLLWVQAQNGAQDSGKKSDDSDEEDVQTIQESVRELESCLGLPKIQYIQATMQTMLTYLANLCNCRVNDSSVESNSGLMQSNALFQMSSMVQSVSPALALVNGAFIREGIRFVWLHKCVAKLAYVATSLFLGLLKEGFCTQEEQNGEGDETEGGGVFKEEEGTGLGDGEGRKDVSDQIENEDQVMGAKQEGVEQEEEENKDTNLEDEDAKGVEMDQDFKGEFQDVAADPDQSGSDEEGDDQRLEDEMGEVGNEGETVDEKLWDDEDDKGKGDQGQDLDNDATIPVDDKKNLDYAEGQDNAEQGEDSPREERRKEQQPLDVEGDADFGNEDDGEEEMETGDEPADPYQQQGMTKPELPDQELELPEDMQLDGMDEGEGESDGGDSGPDIEEPPIQEGEFPDKNQPDSNNDAQSEDPNDPDQQKDNTKNAKEDDEEQQDDDGTGQEVPTEQEGDDMHDKNDDPEKNGGQDAMQHGGIESMSEDEADEGEDKEDDPNIVQGDDGKDDQVDLEDEAGPQGIPSAMAAQADAVGAGADGKDDEEEKGEADGNADRPEQLSGMDEPLQSMQDAPQSGPTGLGVTDTGRKGAPMPAETDASAKNKQDIPPTKQNIGSNPFRSLGDIMERWKANLSVTEEAEEKPQNEEGVDDAADNDVQDDAFDGDEYQFLANGEQNERTAQTLAAATEDQMDQADAIDHSRMDEDQEDGPVFEVVQQDETMEDAKEDEEDAPSSKKPITGQAPRNSSKAKSGMDQKNEDGEGENGQDEGEAEGKPPKDGGEDNQTENMDNVQSFVTANLQRTLDDSGVGSLESILHGGLTNEEADAVRNRIDEQIRGRTVGTLSEDQAAASGREIWHQCQALTSNLAGELAEHLRLILEPTLASRLAGDYKTGKRINMKKVLAYVASQYRKDKIWMRRTKPDKRRYQVLLAIDDSKSMAENGCGTFALESLTLLCRAMSRLDVGELGVASFGGMGQVHMLHPLGVPFTDASGPGIIGHMRFDQDNSIQDRPMVELMTGLGHMLDTAQYRHSSGGSALSSQSLHQLVLIIADGRFHERDSLKRLAHDLCNRRGVLLTFIILDNPKNSLLDLSTVSFVDGKPQFSKYLDGFPFPLYIVLRDIASLPRTLADLLRQWFQISAGQ